MLLTIYLYIEYHEKSEKPGTDRVFLYVKIVTTLHISFSFKFQTSFQSFHYL